MTLSNEEIEKELSSLKPTAPASTIISRIEQNLVQADIRNPDKIVRMWPVVAMASAACLALVLVFTITNRSTETETSAALILTVPLQDSPEAAFANFELIDGEKRLLKATDEGIIFSADNEPVRRLRYQFVDTVTLVNQVDGSVFKMEIPREEILFIPVTLL